MAAANGLMPEARPIGRPTPEYYTAQLGRAIPRLLDSRRMDGGVMRLLTEPGGRIDSQAMRATEIGAEIAPSVALERLKLLVQGPAELDGDFIARATLAPFRSAYWGAVEHLASRPTEQGINVEGNAPPEMRGPKGDEAGGEWFEDIDGHGNDLMAFLTGHLRSTVGYGYGSILTERKGNRGTWRWIEAESIISVEAKNQKLAGPSAVEVIGFDEGEEVCLRLLSAERAGGKWAEAHIHRKGSSGYEQQPADVRKLDPHVEIPLDPIPAQILTSQWWCLPLLLPAAKLDHLLVNISSQTAYAVSQVMTFMRFAKGLEEGDIDKWRDVGPSIFYATTSEEADMKLLYLPADAIKAGADYEDHILRGVEVAGLAPMLTRMPGDEKATGISVATSRARSGAEAIARMIESGVSSAYQRLARYTSTSPDVSIALKTNLGVSEEARAAAELKSRIYLDPKGGMSRPEYWAAMIEHGIAADTVDVDDLTRWAEQANPEQAKLRIERAQLALNAAAEGFLKNAEGQAALYRAMAEAGAIRPPEGQDEETWIRSLAESQNALVD